MRTAEICFLSYTISISHSRSIKFLRPRIHQKPSLIGQYNRDNKFFKARSVAEVVDTIQDERKKEKWTAEIAHVKAIYNELSDTYQKGKANGQESFSFFQIRRRLFGQSGSLSDLEAGKKNLQGPVFLL
jgi:hypothetical protein